MSFLQRERCPICGGRLEIRTTEFKASAEECFKRGYEPGYMVFVRYKVSCVSCNFSTGVSKSVSDAIASYYVTRKSILHSGSEPVAKWHTEFPRIEGLYIVDEGLGPFLRCFVYVDGKWITATGVLDNISHGARFFGPIPNFTTEK